MSEDTLELIAAIYDAAADDQGWERVLDRIHKHVGAAGVTVFAFNRATGMIPFVMTSGIPHEQMNEYKDLYVDKDIRLKIIMGLEPGLVYSTSDNIIPKDIYDAQPFVREFLVPHGYYHGMGAKLVQRDGLIGILGFQARHGIEFTDEKRSLLAPLVPHLGRALEIAVRLSSAVAKGELLEAALDNLVQGVFVLDIGGRIQTLNVFARDIVTRRDGISLTSGGRLAATGEAGARLERIIRDATKFANGTDTDHSMIGGAVSIPRASGRPYAATIVPLPRRQLTIGGQVAGVLVIVADPDRQPVDRYRQAMDLFGLTPAEATLADALAQGVSLKDFAEARSISVNTARTLLARVFAKTQTSRQGELIRLLVLTTMNFDFRR